MNHVPDELLSNALDLSAPVRAEFAARLIASLDPAVDDDAEQAWAAEIDRRLSELNDGQVQMIPWNEVRQILRGPANESAAG